MSQLPRVKRLLIEAMAKQLPPSASALKLIDVGGAAGAILSEGRGDLQVIPVEGTVWNVDENSVDAVVAFDPLIDSAFLSAALRVLRPGGRLIVMHSEGEPDETQFKTLEGAGYHRILVETGAECPLPIGVLMRGEKPHVTEDTLARVRVASDVDSGDLDLAAFSGRYVYLLIKQTPNKPVWALREGDAIHWEAVSVGDVLLAFTSLPKAVSFMQPAVLSGWIHGVNKVAKFKREMVTGWLTGVRLNPALEGVTGQVVTFRAVDPQIAEAPDE